MEKKGRGIQKRGRINEVVVKEVLKQSAKTTSTINNSNNNNNLY